MANASTYRATINLGDLRQGRKGQARIRNGQKHNRGALKGGSQVYKELPRAFLPQKFHRATVIALALGLEGGSKRTACVCTGWGTGRGDTTEALDQPHNPGSSHTHAFGKQKEKQVLRWRRGRVPH